MEKKRKRSIVIGITSLVLVTLLLVGLTYAYYRTRIIGNNSNEPSISVTSKKLGVSYEDGDATLSTEGLIRPGFTATKVFYVENTGDEATEFSILMDNVVNEFNKGTQKRGEYYDWKYYLYSGSEVNDANLLASDYITFDSTQYIIDSASVNKGEKLTYLFKIEYLELKDIDQSDDMRSKLELRVNIGEKPQYTWDDAPSGSLLYALKNNQPSGSGVTIPGQAASTKNEARILETEDDYGTSYVYRGAVLNNYVTFNNMCWRVLRVQGDGSIKLVLADENYPCSSDVEKNVDNTYSGYNSQNIKSALINNSAGYRYNVINSIDDLKYETTSFPTIIDEWAVKKGLAIIDNDGAKTYLEEMVVNDWCNDMSIDKEIAGANNSIIYGFESISRLGDTETAQPTLKCDLVGSVSINNLPTKAIKYTDYIGLLTADEVAFAGSITKLNGTYSHYLTTNAVAFYWTMTPYNYLSNDSSAFVYIVSNNGSIINSSSGNPSYSLRPVIVLKSDVMIITNPDIQTHGNPGTQANPYVVIK